MSAEGAIQEERFALKGARYFYPRSGKVWEFNGEKWIERDPLESDSADIAAAKKSAGIE